MIAPYFAMLAYACTIFSERISAVRRAADDRQNHPAVVRRIGRGVEHLPPVFPGRVTGGLLVRAPLHRVLKPKRQATLHIALMAISLALLPIQGNARLTAIKPMCSIA